MTLFFATLKKEKLYQYENTFGVDAVETLPDSLKIFRKRYCINTYFPLVRKHVYIEAPSYFPIDDVNLPYEFIQWKNNKIICIENQSEIDISKIEVYLYNLYIIIRNYFIKQQQFESLYNFSQYSTRGVIYKDTR